MIDRRLIRNLSLRSVTVKIYSQMASMRKTRMIENRYPAKPIEPVQKVKKVEISLKMPVPTKLS